MPSGISHILLSRYLPIEDNCLYRHKQNANTRYFQIGSIAPDLPYASIIDNNFLENQSILSNLFHFTENNQDMALSPNRLPLAGLEKLKSVRDQGDKNREVDALFWFLMGYASHIIADGVFHPYVMDKVGRYEGSNKSAHRALEMGIDVLLFKHFTALSGHAIEVSYAGMDSFIRGFNELRFANYVLEHFANLIEAIYAFSVTPDEIKEWVTGISRLFCLSTGEWPAWFRRLDITAPFVFRQLNDLKGREDDYLVLTKPKYWDQNFRNTQVVHLFNDALPRFNLMMKSYLDKAYVYVYATGHQITENDLPAFSLDTGRAVDNPNNIDLIPLLWEVA